MLNSSHITDIQLVKIWLLHVENNWDAFPSKQQKRTSTKDTIDDMEVYSNQHRTQPETWDAETKCHQTKLEHPKG